MIHLVRRGESMLVLMRFSHTLLICSQHWHPWNIHPQVEPAQPEAEARLIMYFPPSSTKMVFPSEYLMLSVISYNLHGFNKLVVLCWSWFQPTWLALGHLVMV